MTYPESTDTFTWSDGVRVLMLYRRETSDYNTCLSIIRDDEYRVRELGVVPGGLHLDVGCHIGAWACLVGKLGGRVLAYDPIPENAGLALRNALLNGLDGVRVYPFAVTGGASDHVRVYYSPMQNEVDAAHRFIGTRVDPALAGTREYVEAPAITLDAILAREDDCHILKLDCEGFEYEILRAASLASLRKVRYVIGEYHAVSDGPSGLDALLDCCRGAFRPVEGGRDDKLGGFLLERV